MGKKRPNRRKGRYATDVQLVYFNGTQEKLVV